MIQQAKRPGLFQLTPFILFVSLFAADAFSPGLTIWQQLGAFVIHLIPSFILLTFLIVAWKWELIGGIIFIIIGLALSPVIYVHNYIGAVELIKFVGYPIR